ncbi:MAG: hypothetical protein RLZZ312_1739 [Bacteroidota bacterium]|jgi:hypothetical protein
MDWITIFMQGGYILCFVLFVFVIYGLARGIFAGFKNIGVIIDRQEEIIDLLTDIKTELQKNNKTI